MHTTGVWSSAAGGAEEATGFVQFTVQGTERKGCSDLELWGTDQLKVLLMHTNRYFTSHS